MSHAKRQTWKKQHYRGKQYLYVKLADKKRKKNQTFELSMSTNGTQPELALKRFPMSMHTFITYEVKTAFIIYLFVFFSTGLCTFQAKTAEIVCNLTHNVHLSTSLVHNCFSKHKPSCKCICDSYIKKKKVFDLYNSSPECLNLTIVWTCGCIFTTFYLQPLLNFYALLFNQCPDVNKNLPNAKHLKKIHGLNSVMEDFFLP